MRHGANVIQHNAGGLCALSPGGNDGEPDPLCAARVRTIRIMSCAPAFSPLASATRSSSLALAPAVSAAVSFLSPAVAALPGGSGAVLRRRHRVAVSQKRLSAWRPPLKSVHARPASSGCGGSCRAKRPRVTRSRLASFRCPPWSGVVIQRQTPVRQRCHRAPFRRLRTLCRPHPQTPRRGPAMPPVAAWRPPVTGCRKRT